MVYKGDRRFLQAERLESLRGIAIPQNFPRNGQAMSGSADVAVKGGTRRGEGSRQIRREGDTPVIRPPVAIVVDRLGRFNLNSLRVESGIVEDDGTLVVNSGDLRQRNKHRAAADGVAVLKT